MNAFDASSSEEEDVIPSPPALHIDWLCVMSSSFPNLGITSLPGCRFRNTRRNLHEDIAKIVSSSVSDVFVLCTSAELVRYRVSNLLSSYRLASVEVHHWPCLDGTVPALDELLHHLQEIEALLKSGAKILIHCYGGLGRACVVTACLLMQLDEDLVPEAVIEELRRIRGRGAVQTVKQYNFIMEFHQRKQAYLG